MADTQVKSFCSQGLPRHIFNNPQSNSTAKENLGISGDAYARIDLYSSLKASMPTCQKDPEQEQLQVLLIHWLYCSSLKWFPKAVSTPQQAAPDFLNSRTSATVHDGTLLLSRFSGRLQVMLVKQVLEAKKGDMLQLQSRGHVHRHCTEPREDETLSIKDKALLMEAKRKEIRGMNDPMPAYCRFMATCHPLCNQQSVMRFCSKSTLSGKEKSIAFLQSEKEKILSEKKELADSYLDEIVICQAVLTVLYDADTLFHPTHHPVSIWDSEEVLVHQVVSMKKMNEKPGHVRPANGFYEKLNALRQQLHGKDDTISNLDAQINIMQSVNAILLTYVTAVHEKLSAFMLKIQAESPVTGTTSSGPSTSEDTQSVAQGMIKT
ncbi:hypothetical protein Tco_0626739 [Tanacetum coccineum]|uniref:Uncharacterized protein n=1 Tax=Tanacetum coccineum TaxID=301880 RepID=A0ABQ4WKI9_9ASTR